MKTRNYPRLALAALLLAAPLATIGLTASAAPVPQADRYVSMAFSRSTQDWYGARSSDPEKAKWGALDRCNLYQSAGAYDCVSAGVALNQYLAVALSKPYRGWGSAAAKYASLAGEAALKGCKYNPEDAKYCRIVFNQHSSEH